MASLFDQYEQLRSVSSTPPIASSYVEAKFANMARSRPIVKSSDEVPLLKRHKIDFEPDESITHLAASNNQIVIATKDKRLTFIDDANNSQMEYDLSRHLGDRCALAKIYRIFLDPTGKFLLISITHQADGLPMENLLYSKRMQTLPRLRGHLISAVAWNFLYSQADKQNSTGTILIGTSKGLVFQTELIAHDEPRFFPLSTTPEHYVRQVFDVGLELAPITGIEFHQITPSIQPPSPPSTSLPDRRYHIMVTTNNRLYRMIGSVSANVEPPPLQNVFTANADRYQDMPGKLGFSKLDLYYASPASAPIRFAWLTEPGILTGEIINGPGGNLELTKDNGTTLISYTNQDHDFDSIEINTPLLGDGGSYLSRFDEKPLSVLVTKFHILILFRRCLRAVCALNEQTVYEEYLPSTYGSVVGMSKDPIKNIVWLFAERAMLRYRLSQEDKNIWRIYLAKGDYEMAKKYSARQPLNYDRVLCEEAQYYYNHGDHCRSAEIFAKSQKSFEEIALKFMQTDKRQALIRFLVIKINMIEDRHTIQLTMMLAWLIEILLSEMSRVRCDEPFSEMKEPTRQQELHNSLGSGTLSNDKDVDLKQLESEFERLLKDDKTRNIVSRNSNLYYGIALNYADMDNYIKMATAIGDYERIIQHYMVEHEFDRALEVMKRFKKDEPFYQHGPILMRHIPEELVDSLIKRTHLDCVKLIPTLLQEDPANKNNESLRYLEFCVKTLHVEDEIVHNYLFELYARHRPLSVIEYLQQFQTEERYYLDLQYGLRLCTELGLDEACVILYSAQGLHDEALNLSLKFDVELAKRIANKAESDDHKKQLWLTISEHVLRKNHDIKQAMKILQEFPLLKIEDILPFFPDYTNIDYFRAAIRQSLTEYKRIINELRDGAPETMAREISEEITAFRNRYSVIKADRLCDVCGQNLLAGSFYAFPCGHLFHCECMLVELNSVLSHEQMKQIEDIQREINELQSEEMAPKYRQQSALAFLYNSTRETYIGATQPSQLVSSAQIPQTASTPPRRSRNELIDELNKLASQECVHCGEALALTIDRPFDGDMFE